MTNFWFNETGDFAHDVVRNEYRSCPLWLPMLGLDVIVVLVGVADDPLPNEFHDVVRNILAQTRETLLAASPDLHNYCMDINQFLEPEDEFHVEDPRDLWKHVQFGDEVYIQRRHHGDKKVYATIGCDCDWEEEHGLQLVLREGLAVTKLGPHDGHLSNADAFADTSFENTIYCRTG